jgi:hypothetical protein
MTQQPIQLEAIIEKLRMAAGHAAVEIAAHQAALEQANARIEGLVKALDDQIELNNDLRAILESEPEKIEAAAEAVTPA